MDYLDMFKSHYSEWVKTFEDDLLVACEDNISRLIDSDLFSDCILVDEITLLYEIIRSECVCRFIESCKVSECNRGGGKASV